MWDLAFDPVTGDLIRDDAGGWETTESGDTSVLHQVSIHYGQFWGDPGIGSMLYDRDRFVTAPATLVASELTRAMALLESEKLISNVRVAADDSQKAGRVVGRTTYRVVATGKVVSALIPVLGTLPVADSGLSLSFGGV